MLEYITSAHIARKVKLKRLTVFIFVDIVDILKHFT